LKLNLALIFSLSVVNLLAENFQLSVLVVTVFNSEELRLISSIAKIETLTVVIVSELQIAIYFGKESILAAFWDEIDGGGMRLIGLVYELLKIFGDLPIDFHVNVEDVMLLGLDILNEKFVLVDQRRRGQIIT